MRPIPTHTSLPPCSRRSRTSRSGGGAGGESYAEGEIVRLNAINAEMMKSEDKQISLTDPDARSMATSGKDTGIVGYNADCG
jgi:hypothetical protein